MSNVESAPTLHQKSEVEKNRLGQLGEDPLSLHIVFKSVPHMIDTVTLAKCLPQQRQEFVRSFVDAAQRQVFWPNLLLQSKIYHHPSRSVVGEFNRIQRENGLGECSNGSSHNWLKEYRPKVAICPHRQDYCDTCSRHNVEVHTKQTTINRLRQASNSEPDEIKKLEDELATLKEAHENHRQKAQKAHQYYTYTTASCALEWKQIKDLEEKATRTEDEEKELTTLKH